MQKRIFLIFLIFLLIFKSAFSGYVAELSIYESYIPIPYILSDFEPYFILENTGNMTANITKQEVIGMTVLNHSLGNPLEIPSDSLRKYEFNLGRKFSCNEFGDSYNFNVNVTYNNETNIIDNITSKTYSIQVKNPLNIANVSVSTTEKLTVKMTKSKKIYVIVENNASTPLEYNFSVSYPKTFYIKFSTPSETYEKKDLLDTNFTISPKQKETLTLDIAPVFEGEGVLFFQAREISGCQNAQSNFSLVIKTFTEAVTKEQEIIPGLDFLSIMILFVLAFFVKYREISSSKDL